MDSSGMYPPPSTKSRGKDRKNKHKRNREEAPANIAPQEFAVTGRGSEPDPVYQEESHNNKTLLRAKDNGQFSSVWADEATCALVQQICVVLRDQFKGSRNTGAAWRTVADNLNQLGYKLGEHKDSRISSDECKSRWHHIGKEARKYKRRLMEEGGNARKPKVVTILGESLEQDLLDFIGEVPPKPTPQSGGRPSGGAIGHHIHGGDEYEDGSKDNFQLFPMTLEHHGAGYQGGSLPSQGSGSGKRQRTDPEDFTSPPNAQNAAYRQHLREQKNKAIETLLSSARNRSDVRVTISRAIKLMERRTETVLKAFEMASPDGHFELATFVSLMDVILAAEE
eukprot:gb/GECG01013718.1/.p1 GENE.gb/GECG01013718.1/~~gb/GECG01013718.1/.p1  ORF type:complete len:338 (+),score=58.11 gb/GECG01013718.1/:1-1014(+)